MSDSLTEVAIVAERLVFIDHSWLYGWFWLNLVLLWSLYPQNLHSDEIRGDFNFHSYHYPACLHEDLLALGRSTFLCSSLCWSECNAYVSSIHTTGKGAQEPIVCSCHGFWQFSCIWDVASWEWKKKLKLRDKGRRRFFENIGLDMLIFAFLNWRALNILQDS